MEELIAKTCHAAHLAYSNTHGLKTQPAWKDVEKSHKDAMFSSIKNIMSGVLKSPEDSHKNFIKMKLDAGWIYGKEYSIENKTNPRLVKFEELNIHDVARGVIFHSIVVAMTEDA